MENYLKKLEYDKILNLLKGNAITTLGKEKCENLIPSFNKEDVEKLLSETNEATIISLRKGLAPIFDIDDSVLIFKKLESSISLLPKELLNLGNILKISRNLKEYFYNDKDFDLSSFPILDNYFSNLYLNKGLEDKIFFSIIDEENISDNASKKLSSLRRNKKNLENQIKDTLNKMIHSSNYSKYIMDELITIKNDRYVIPVKEEYRSYIKGFIHDISQSRLYFIY